MVEFCPSQGKRWDESRITVKGPHRVQTVAYNNKARTTDKGG